MRVVVKIGGAALENETTLRKCSHAVVELTARRPSSRRGARRRRGTDAHPGANGQDKANS